MRASMRMRIRPFIGRTDGAAATEFALVLPIFAMVMLGTIEVARVIYTQSVVRKVIHSVSREAMIDSSLSDAQLKTNVATAVAKVGVEADEITVASTTNGDGTATINFVVSFQHSLNIPFVANNGLSLQSDASIVRSE